MFFVPVLVFLKWKVSPYSLENKVSFISLLKLPKLFNICTELVNKLGGDASILEELLFSEPFLLVF